jgi:hypothetical protein
MLLVQRVDRVARGGLLCVVLCPESGTVGRVASGITQHTNVTLAIFDYPHDDAQSIADKPSRRVEPFPHANDEPVRPQGKALGH